MLAIGAILAFVGLLALVGGLFQRVRAGRLANTPFVKSGEVSPSKAGDKGAISTEGKVVAPQLLTSPVTGTPCLYYDVVVNAQWKVGDSSHTQRVSEEKQATPFGVDDGSGPAWIDANKGGDFDFKSFRKKDSRGLMSAFTGRPLTFGDRGFSIPTGIRVGLVHVPDSAEFEVVERVLPAAPFFFANGKLDESGKIGSPSWTALVLSEKPREELMAGTGKMAKMLLTGGGVAAAAGTLLAGIGAALS
jgi:hypothetical protein